ncbi:hypothetical protein R3P38DRAFT_3240429 [Favolaschia claudopus]|uniref:F-box domain-containing protein n=1 Tax=Favolaschia claudopus TaxID=2862362 RepID=A0AAV9Z772_9AGAR
MAIESFPVEVLCRALRAVFISPNAVNAGMPVQRDVLRSVCHLWRDAIDHDAVSWAHSFVTYSTPPEQLRMWLLKSRNVPLAIDLHFPNTHAPLEVQTIHQLFFILAPFMPRCQQLRVRVANNKIGTHAVGLLADMRLDSLSTVDIIMAPPYQSPRFDTFARTPPRNLVNLSFHRSFPTWSDKSSFSGVRSLTLSNITSFPRPFLGDIKEFFDSVPNLEHLAIKHVDPHMVILRRTASTRIVLPRLLQLEFAMRRARCSQFLSVLSAPNLEGLALTLEREEDVLPCLQQCGSLFPSVLCLQLACYFPSYTVLTTALAGFSALVQLDGRLSPGFSLAFYGASLYCVDLCPDLARVCVAELPRILVEDILCRRSPTNFAPDLRVYANLPSLAYAEYSLSGGQVLCRPSFVESLV